VCDVLLRFLDSRWPKLVGRVSEDSMGTKLQEQLEDPWDQLEAIVNTMATCSKPLHALRDTTQWIKPAIFKYNIQTSGLYGRMLREEQLGQLETSGEILCTVSNTIRSLPRMNITIYGLCINQSPDDLS
jgi:hypothetical protein